MAVCPVVTPSIKRRRAFPSSLQKKWSQVRPLPVSLSRPAGAGCPGKCTFGMQVALVPLCAAFAPQPLLPRTLASPRLAVRAAVAESEEVDFVVVGSGIGGLSCAGLLAASGYEVATLPRC